MASCRCEATSQTQCDLRDRCDRGVGLSGNDDHSEKETADLRMLPVQTRRAALVLHRLTLGERPQP